MEFGVDRAYTLLTDKFTGWVTKSIEMLPNFVAAILIVITFYVIGWVVRRVINRTLLSITNNRAVVRLIETVVGIAIVTTGIFIALGILKLDGTVTSLLAGVGVIGLALGFAFQDIAANFMSGVILSIQHPYGIDDMIECKDYYGYVHDINLRSTVIRTTQGQLIHVPNKEILNSPLTNYSWNHKRRIDIELGIACDADHKKAQRLAVEAVRSLKACDQERPVDLYYTGIGAYSFNCTLRFWVDFRLHADFLSPRSEAIIAVGKIFAENDITIPYPIRTLEFDGQPASERFHPPPHHPPRRPRVPKIQGSAPMRTFNAGSPSGIAPGRDARSSAAAPHR